MNMEFTDGTGTDTERWREKIWIVELLSVTSKITTIKNVIINHQCSFNWGRGTDYRNVKM